MLITVDDYRTISGDVTTSDAQVSAAITRMQARIESYIQRRLESQDYVEKHIHLTPHPILLKEYPVTALTTVTKEGTEVSVGDMLVNSDTGVLHHNSALSWAKYAEVTYTAGYETCPDDIKYILCELVESRLNGTLDASGPQEARSLRKETVYGVSSVEYFAGTATSSLEFFPELGPYVAVLDRYKRPFEVPKF